MVFDEVKIVTAVCVAFVDTYSMQVISTQLVLLNLLKDILDLLVYCVYLKLNLFLFLNKAFLILRNLVANLVEVVNIYEWIVRRSCIVTIKL